MSVMRGLMEATGADRVGARLVTVLGGDEAAVVKATSNKPQNDFANFLARLRETSPPDVKDSVGTIVGAAAGGILIKKHRVLGAIGGASLGRNVPALLKSNERRDALCNMGQTGAGILVSSISPGAPVVGFIVGWLISGVAMHYTGIRAAA